MTSNRNLDFNRPQNEPNRVRTDGGSQQGGVEYDISALNILVAGDNKYMQTLLKEILRAFGVRTIQTAADGAEALKILQTFPADMVITDWMMTPLDRLELTKMIRSDTSPSIRFLPIILITGYTDYQRVMEALDSGVTEFLVKPVSAYLVYSRIRSIIEKPRTFIKTKRYVGPDRRRGKRLTSNYKGPERRQS
jgi:two-component system chemotaxis response regulator CheY